MLLVAKVVFIYNCHCIWITWATHSWFDPCFPNDRYTVDRAFDVEAEYVPVEIKQRERKVVLNLPKSDLESYACKQFNNR